ncbi:MAG: prefoldin subunit alpha [Candidatus Thermoplasmatota archaeon]|nr:prefoldin subunit alpha [Candidatus Thermoplasmatota archaeon]
MENENRVDIQGELNYLRSLIDSMDNQLSVLIRGMDELRKTHAVLKEDQLASAKEMRVTVGSGIFVKAKLELDQNLFVPIGSDLYVEEESPKTLVRIDQNVKDIEVSIQNVQARRSEVSTRYNSLVSMVQQQEQIQQKGQS